MKSTSRREFLVKSSLGLAVAGSMAGRSALLQANPLGLPIGFQIYPVREQAVKDFAGTMREMAQAGFQAMELCSFPGYVSSGFGPLEKMKPSEVRQILKDAGLSCESCHYTAGELKNNLGERITFAKELGLKYMILSSFGLPRETSLDDWKRAADELNEVGAETRKAGIQAGFHNHNFEFKELEGVLIYDELMKRLDPKLVKMQFQCAVVSIGFDPVTYVSKYPGRFCSLHLADWSPTEKKSMPVGQGVIDWKKLFAVSKAAGVKNYYAEMDKELMKASVPYLQKLKV